MVSTCVCAGCTNSNLSGHRVHIFPSKKNPAFCSWVRFVQAKRQNFTAKSVHPRNSVICSVHFVEKDYVESDLVAFKMGYKSIRNVRLKTDAVPTVYVAAAIPAVAPNQQQPPRKLWPVPKREANGIVQTASASAAAASLVSPAADVDARMGSVIEEVQELSEPVRTRADRSTQRNDKRPYCYRSSDIFQAAATGGGASSSVMAGYGNWDGVGGRDQITVVRREDTHITEDQSAIGGKVKADVSEYYEVEYSIPAEEEAAGDEEEDGVYVIEYSNPEEEGESYKFMMSVDRSLQARKPVTKHAEVRENARAPCRPKRLNQKRKRR